MTTTTIFIVLCGALLVSGAFIRRPHLNGRIVGGADAEIEDHPYQLSLRSDGYNLCSATIISPDWIMTAGHCVRTASSGSMVLRAGSSKLNSGGVLYGVSRVIRHEQHDPDTSDYDFALLNVDTPFTFGPGVQPIGLVDAEPAAGESAVMTGWGQTGPNGGILSEQLQVAHVPIFDRDQCKENYVSYQPVTARMICAGLDEGGVNIGGGDNGGPLVVGGKLAGVASWGAGGAKPGLPPVYSNIANQRAWIKKNSGI